MILYIVILYCTVLYEVVRKIPFIRIPLSDVIRYGTGKPNSIRVLYADRTAYTMRIPTSEY